MAVNLLEQLADLDVPPPPAKFDTQLHDRVNRSLLREQLVDLFVSGLPWAALEFGRAMIGLVSLTLTGRYEPVPKNKRRPPRE
jgi:hypothetical protein